MFSDFVLCRHCNENLIVDLAFLIEHCRVCDVSRPDRTYEYVCFECPYHVRFGSHIRRHISSHLGVKPYKCNHCSYSSCQLGNVTSHMRIKHAII